MGTRFINVSISGPVNKYARQAGLPKVCNLGWWQAGNGSYAGKLHPINFAQSVLIPEFQGATGAWLWLKPDLNWTAVNFDEPPNGFSASTDTGLINLALALGSNWNPPGISAGTRQPVSFSHVSTVPMNNLTGSLVPSSANQLLATEDPVTKEGSWSLWATALGFASEIAQQACYYNAAETYTDFSPITGSRLCALSDGNVRNAKIDVGTISDNADVDFGSTGLKMLGWYAWYYDGYLGELEYINSQQVYTVPKMPTATGLYIILKNGCVGSVSLGNNTFVSQSMIASLKEINFAANIVSGVAP